MQDLNALVLPPAVEVFCNGTPLDEVLQNKFNQVTEMTVTFHPHERLWLDKDVTFHIRIPLTYPSMPPIVTCTTAAFISEYRDVARLDESGKPTLRILNADGWCRLYTISHVVYSLHSLLVMKGLSDTLMVACPPSAKICTEIKTYSGSCELQGCRPTMEDALVKLDNLQSSASQSDSSIRGHAYAMYAVYDGHGGSTSSRFAQQHLSEHVVELLSEGKSAR